MEATLFMTIANDEMIAFLGTFTSVVGSTRDAANEDTTTENSSIGVDA
jgi:hypothetical protein